MLSLCARLRPIASCTSSRLGDVGLAAWYARLPHTIRYHHNRGARPTQLLRSPHLFQKLALCGISTLLRQTRLWLACHRRLPTAPPTACYSCRKLSCDACFCSAVAVNCCCSSYLLLPRSAQCCVLSNPAPFHPPSRPISAGPGPYSRIPPGSSVTHSTPPSSIRPCRPNRSQSLAIGCRTSTSAIPFLDPAATAVRADHTTYPHH